MIIGILVFVGFLLLGYLLHQLLSDLVRLEDEVDALREEVRGYAALKESLMAILAENKGEEE